jgi:hypothetical protein
MRSFFRGSLVASAACLIVVNAVAQTAAPPPAAPETSKVMQRWVDDRTAMLDARLGGLKAGLQLTPDQEKLWAPFEAAVRDFAETRLNRLEGVLERAGRGEGPDRAGPPPSPLDRLDRMATRLSDVGASLKKIADAGKPLYDSLDDQQRRMFGFLSREMMKMGRDGHEWGPPGQHHDGADENEDDEE